MPIPIGVPMAVGLGSALLSKGGNEKETPSESAPPQQQSVWTLSSLIPKTDMKALIHVALPKNTVPWNIEPARLALLKKICYQHGFARQGDLQDLERRILAGLHWNEAQLQKQLQTIYLTQVKDGAMLQMRLGVAAFATATSTAAEPFVPGFAKPPTPDPFEGNKEALLRRLSVRNGLPETGNIKKLSYQLQRNLGWDDEQLLAKLTIEFHVQKTNTWLPSLPKQNTGTEDENVDEEKAEAETKEKDLHEAPTPAAAAAAAEEEEEEEEDSNWEYLKASPSNKSTSESEGDEHLERKESDSEAATEPSNLRYRALQRTHSAVSDAASDSSYEVIDN